MVEVEVVQGLDRTEAGRADPKSGAGGVAGGDLAFQDRGQVVLMGPPGVAGVVGQARGGLGDPRRLQRGGQVGDLLQRLVPAGLRLLDEGPPSLGRTRSRTIRTFRIGIMLAFFAQCAASAALIAWFAQLPRAHLIAVVLAQTALGIMGSSTLGSGRGWVLPGSLTLLATTPGLLPWEINAIYNQKLTAQMSVHVALLIGFAAAAYLTWGLERARLSI